MSALATQNINQNSFDIALSEAKTDIEKILPRHVSFDKFIRVCSIAAMNTPELRECDKESLVQSFMRCASLGLAPDGRESAIVVYNSRVGQNWIKKAQFQPMIDGVLKMLRQSGVVESVIAKAVHEHDTFDYFFDTNGENFSFRPNFNGERGEIRLFFAVAKLKTGEQVIEVMTRAEVDQIMYMSKSAVDKKTGEINPNSVWGKFYSRMGLKTILHRISKRLPNSAEVIEALETDLQMKKMDSNGIFEQIEDSQSQKKPSLNEVDAITENANEFAISSEQQEELKSLVEETGSDEARMFSWISSKSGKLVETYGSLDEEQYKAIKKLLDAKK